MDDGGANPSSPPYPPAPDCHTVLSVTTCLYNLHAIRSPSPYRQNGLEPWMRERAVDPFRPSCAGLDWTGLCRARLVTLSVSHRPLPLSFLPLSLAAMAAAAAAASSTPALYSTCLIDSGRVVLIGPFFDTLAAAREWCDSGHFASKRTGTWTAFAMTAVHPVATAAVAASFMPALYSTCLIDGGRVVSTGPFFDAPAAAREWCDPPHSASTRTGTWTAFAMTAVYIAITHSPAPSPALTGTAVTAFPPSAGATPGFNGRLTAWVACLTRGAATISTAGPIFFDPTEPELSRYAATAWCARQNARLKQQGTHGIEWHAFERGLNPASDRTDNLFPAAGPYAHAAQEQQAEAAKEKE